MKTEDDLSKWMQAADAVLAQLEARFLGDRALARSDDRSCARHRRWQGQRARPPGSRGKGQACERLLAAA
ncbi:hypothetical protein BG60_01800 [Caballeronia zhejiangensis]|uniref:Uncharacterized protein n=1 Tax=Caballeronia zhejiangensis TaxID=871203 RepID=A0A656QUJ0_9BURK|nr:hypothetical protein BG60_01800 [Caballeronia zhejiangensis]